MAPATEMKKRIWCVYNHVPGGQLVAIHFDTLTRKKKVGDGTEEIVFSADEQMKGFKGSDFVGLKMAGKDFQKNEVLVFPENVQMDSKDPAGQVLAWAVEQGAEPITAPAEKKIIGAGATPELSAAEKKKIEDLEKNVSDLQKGQADLKTGIESILALLNKPKEA